MQSTASKFRSLPFSVVIIHEVIMQQSKIVIYLECQGGIKNFLYIITIHIISHEHQYRTNAFTTTQGAVFHGILNLECIKLDGDYYVIQYHGSEWKNGKRIENDLHIEYGDYYDYIMEIMVDTYSVVTGERTDYYGRFKLDDIAKLMK